MVMRNSLQRAIAKKYPEITVDYWVVLNRLWVKGGWSQSELAKLTNKDNASMTRILDGMQKKGLIDRMRDKYDRRAHKIYKTYKGDQLEEPLKQIAYDNMMKGLENFSPEEIENLKSLLNRIIKNY